MHRLPFLALLLLPAAAAAQGRIIVRPCVAPPECGPRGDCPVRSQAACGPTLVRTSSAVKAGLADRVIRYEVTETFVNRGPSVAEADYIFPLPSGAAFEDLKLSINGELVSGETMSAEKARGIYEEIVRKLRDPALVEWMGSGLLRTRIFPIQPGEEKKVVVRFQAVAQREGDALRIDYRRGSDPNAGGRPEVRPMTVERPTRPDHDDGHVEWTTFSLLYEPGSTYGEAYSPTHRLRTRDDGRTRLVEAHGSAGDITILLPLRRPNAAGISVLTHAPSHERGFALITITPPAAPRRFLPRDVTFVVDVSGSMRGRKLEQAKAAGYTLLETLDERDRFRVIDFSTDVRAFRGSFVGASRENVRAARRYIDDLRADGSTNISGALVEALDVKSDGERLPLVVFITDGEPTVGERSPERIATIAARQRGDARLFTIGVSAEVNSALIEQLALDGRGTAHFVRDDESVERTTSLLARRLTAPVLSDVRLRVDGVRLSHVLPAGPIDVFAGQDVVVLARYEGSGRASVRLEGSAADGPINWSTPAMFAERERGNVFVPRLWAAQRIGWLASEKRRNGGNSELDGEIRTLGERYGIPTEFSSYLVVEPGMPLGRRDVAAQIGQLAPTAMSTREERQRMQSGAGMRADSARPASAASPRLPDARSNEFEAARDAAAKRELKSVAELDEASSANTRRIAGRTMTLAKGVWTDARYNAQLRTVTVKPYTAAYFALAQRMTDLSTLFTLGDRLIVAGTRVAIALAPDGVDQLSEAELAQIARDW
jgi:Ca-activated chloride channel family protein